MNSAAETTTNVTTPSVPREDCRWDGWVGLVLVVLIACGIWRLTADVPRAVLDSTNPDIYFSSDVSRVHANMVSRSSNHFRTNVHPLFSVVFSPAYHAVAAMTGAGMHQEPLSNAAVRTGRILSVVAASLAGILFYAILRTTAVRRLDAIIFTLLAMVSAFSLFWFSVPETYPWGASTLLFAMLVAALACRRQLPFGWYVAANVASLSVTTTNIMAGAAAAWAKLTWKKTALSLAIGGAIVLGGALVQKVVFPSSRLFIHFGGEKAYVMQQSGGGVMERWRSIAAHTVVMPEVQTAPHVSAKGKTVLRTQFSRAGSFSIYGKLALVAWAVLLAIGVYALVTLSDFGGFRLALGLTIAGQLALHTIYGAETFLYGADYGPLLIAMTALGTRTRFRLVVLVLAVGCIAGFAANNLEAFHHTMALVRQHASP